MRCTESPFSDTYLAVHRYDGAVIQRGRRERLVPCAVQPRDVAIVFDVRRYKFLTAPQLRELWWPEASVQAADRRLLKLYRAGYLDRFRPICRRGSFPWTYQLGLEGHRLLQRAGLIQPRERFLRREVYDYGHVLHDLQLNAWVLAYRRAAGDAFLSWEGETHTEPPREARAQQGVLKLGNYWSAEGLRDPRSRPVRPDAVIEVARSDGDGSRVFLIEYDRTQRVDKNYEKFRRYDTFLCWWWQHTEFADGARPFVIFVCQDEDQRERFVNAADHELTGQLWHPTAAPDDKVYVGRQRVLFTCELDMHVGQLEAWRLANAPPDDARRGGTATVRRVRLPA
jgi:protein involved in plasmid replication-relaxation